MLPEMWLKLLLVALFLTSLVGAFLVEPLHNIRDGRVADDRGEDHLRLLTWNIGNGDLESETRAHSEDLPAVAKVILDNDVDAVALQELTGEEQLKLLLSHLENRYRGYVCNRGSSDRVEAVLVKDHNWISKDKEAVIFSDVPAGNRFAAAATFRLRKDSSQVLFVSAHADAFSAARRRTFAAEVVDWTRIRSQGDLVLIAGDFNFEVSTRTRNNLFTDDAKHDSEAYAYLLKYFRDLGREAGDTSINDRRIDYVFGPTTTISVRRAEVLRGAAVGRMDHWPLLVEVGF